MQEDISSITPSRPKFRCFIGMHVYSIYDTKSVLNGRGEVVGIVIINRCRSCGKLKQFRISTFSDNHS